MKKNNNLENEILPQDIIEKYNITAEELEMLKDAQAIVDTVAMLPDNAEKFIDKIQKEFPNDYDGAWKKFAEVIQKDPKFLNQLIAFNEISNTVSEEKPPVVEKLSSNQLKSKHTDELIADVMSKLGYKK